MYLDITLCNLNTEVKNNTFPICTVVQVVIHIRVVVNPISNKAKLFQQFQNVRNFIINTRLTLGTFTCHIEKAITGVY